MATINRKANYEEKQQALRNGKTFSIAEILDVVELLKAEQWPDGQFGDDECCLWSALRRELDITYSNERKSKYDVRKQGAVVAIRIYFEGDRNPMADLILAFGEKVTINWVNPVQREEYASGINGYTLIYDERNKRPFEDWM